MKNIDGDRVLRNVANGSRAEALLITISRTDGLDESSGLPQCSQHGLLSAVCSVCDVGFEIKWVPDVDLPVFTGICSSQIHGCARQDGLNSGRMHRGELVARMKKVVITACGDESKLAIVESDLPDPVVGEVQLSLLSRIQRIEG